MTTPINQDAGQRLRVSQLTTLFDGKTLGADNANLWNEAGTGSSAFSENQKNLSVTSGQWLVRQSNVFTPYFSGKSQLIECTFRNFHAQTGITKRVGYFSSSAVSPHTAALDGFFLENDGTSIFLVVMRNGTQVAKIDSSQFDNARAIANYDWLKFTVILFDFLWLGGTDLRLFIQSPNDGFVLLHTYQHCGNADNTMLLSPNLPIRYEIRSSSGSGTFSAICSQVSTEGSNNESGEPLAIFNTASITANSVGTIYAIKSIKKQSAYRDTAVIITSIGTINTASSDAGILLLIKDPTVSAPIVYANKGKIQEGTPTTQTVTAGTGTVIVAAPVSQNGISDELKQSTLVWLQNKIDDTLSEYVIAYMPTTANQSVNATLSIKMIG